MALTGTILSWDATGSSQMLEDLSSSLRVTIYRYAVLAASQIGPAYILGNLFPSRLSAALAV